MTNTITGDLRITGRLIMDGSKLPGIERSVLALESLAIYNLDPSNWRVWDDLSSLLPSTSAGDDLGVSGTFGSAFPTLKTGDISGAGSTDKYARRILALPPEYDDGKTIRIDVRAKMNTNVADNSATLDLELYRHDGDGGIGSDLISTAAQDINSTTAGDLEFSVSSGSLIKGDILDLRMKVSTNDAATSGSVEAEVLFTKLLLDIKG